MTFSFKIQSEKESSKKLKKFMNKIQTNLIETNEK